MANPEHVSLLKQGHVQFNKWREDNPNVTPDLEKADLREAKMPYVNLNRAKLREADLGDAILYDATLREADLWGADLTNANLLHVDCSGAEFYRVQFLGANLQGCNLNRAVLINADLANVDLRSADLTDANLNGATNANLVGTDNYILDGINTSTWVIPPKPLLPRFVWPDSKFQRTPRWQLWKLRFYLPYSDPWSSVRRSYTGVMTAFHLILAVTALGPYALRAVLAEIGDYGLPRLAVALGWGRDDAWFLVPTGILLVGYNLFRIMATWWLSQLREEELRSGYAPTTSQYWLFWRLHQYCFRWVGYFAVVLGLWRTGWWLFEWV